MKTVFFIIPVSILLIGSIAFSSVSTNFSFISKDGTAEISGKLTYSDAISSNIPLVIMVPGTGLFDSDVHFGRSGTEKDFIFVAIEKELLKLGYAVLRTNYRGVFCNFANFPGKELAVSPQDQFQTFKNECIDNSIRLGVTPENIRDDLEQIYNWGSRQSRIDLKNILMFGHSEGSTHIARLIEQNRIEPNSLIFMGGVTESLDSLIRWQMVERIVDGVVAMDTNNDGIVTNTEITISHPYSVLSIFPLNSLLSPTGSWTKQSIFTTLETQYSAVKADALSKEDMVPYPDSDVTQASYRWWKMFFQKDSPIIEALSGFQGRVIYHNGSVDSQTNAQRQKDFIDSYTGNKPNLVEFITHLGKGHTLSNDPLWGPIDDNSMSILMKSFESIKHNF